MLFTHTWSKKRQCLNSAASAALGMQIPVYVTEVQDP